MKRKRFLQTVSIVILIAILSILYIIRKNSVHNNKELAFAYPFKGALFPPEFPAPSFKWIDRNNNVSQWKITISTQSKNYSSAIICGQSHWQPSSSQWDSIKAMSNHKKIFAEVSRLAANNSKMKNINDRIYFKISEDEVGAPILYREIPLPFAYAEKHPDSMSYRLVNIGSKDPPHYVMKKFMVCGNCHSFSSDGRTVGLDFDAAVRDKGGYFIADIKDTIVFDTSNYLSWNKLQNRNSFGMLSKISPDGRYVVTTIRDRVISYSYGFSPDVMAFSQLFFPVNGVLAIYDRTTGKLHDLPGANLEEYVQSNSHWTPDGKNIIFARAKALPYTHDTLETKLYDEDLINEFVNRRRDFKFDLYMIPFNNGKGGIAKPIKGASDNGMSNYFPAVSPDGKWLVFCKAKNYMLLMPESRMYIVPLEGGKARKLKCNFYLMNSWHAWSPNSKWIVFSSKGLSAYTDMFLTHIDEQGNASVPVVIEKAHKTGRATNYPEFLNTKADYVFSMIYNYVNLDHITRAMVAGDTTLAKSLYNQFIAQGQYSLAHEFIFLGRFNLELKQYDEAVRFFELALDKEPGNNEANALLLIAKNR